MNTTIARFLGEVTTWAATHAGVHGVALVGSYARGTATETSDVDLIVLTDQRSALLSDTQWVEAFGNVVSLSTEHYGKVVSLRVYYESQLEIEFALADPGWAAAPLDPGTRDVVAGGIKVLFDPHGLLRSMCSKL